MWELFAPSPPLPASCPARRGNERQSNGAIVMMSEQSKQFQEVISLLHLKTMLEKHAILPRQK